MGKPMSWKPLRPGYSLVVYETVPSPGAQLVAAGASRGESCADIAAQSEVIITMLPSGPNIEQAVLAPGGVIEGARVGVSGGEPRAIDGPLAIMVGSELPGLRGGFAHPPKDGGERDANRTGRRG
jgi:2-hydroxy-3-oxopropionate reductase